MIHDAHELFYAEEYRGAGTRSHELTGSTKLAKIICKITNKRMQAELHDSHATRAQDFELRHRRIIDVFPSPEWHVFGSTRWASVAVRQRTLATSASSRPTCAGERVVAHDNGVVDMGGGGSSGVGMEALRKRCAVLLLSTTVSFKESKTPRAPFLVGRNAAVRQLHKHET